MSAQPLKRVLCNGKPDHPQCKTCARHIEEPKPGAFQPPEFVADKCPMRVQK